MPYHPSVHHPFRYRVGSIPLGNMCYINMLLQVYLHCSCQHVLTLLISKSLDAPLSLSRMFKMDESEWTQYGGLWGGSCCDIKAWHCVKSHLYWMAVSSLSKGAVIRDKKVSESPLVSYKASIKANWFGTTWTIDEEVLIRLKSDPKVLLVDF